MANKPPKWCHLMANSTRIERIWCMFAHPPHGDPARFRLQDADGYGSFHNTFDTHRNQLMPEYHQMGRVWNEFSSNHSNLKLTRFLSFAARSCGRATCKVSIRTSGASSVPPIHLPWSARTTRLQVVTRIYSTKYKMYQNDQNVPRGHNSTTHNLANCYLPCTGSS